MNMFHRRRERENGRHAQLLTQLLLLNTKIDKMQSDVQALVNNETTLEGLLTQLITLFQSYQGQVQSGIDAEDLTAIQAVNTKMAGDISTIQAALPQPAPTPAPAPAAEGTPAS